MFTGTLSINQGDSFSYNLNVVDCSGNPLSLSGLSGAGYLKMKYGSSGLLDSFNTNITNFSGGVINLALTPAQTSNYPINQGVYGIYVFTSGTPLNSGAYQSQVAQGYINVFPEMLSIFTGLP